MGKFLYNIVYFIYDCHEYLLSLNDNFSYRLSDKELHFIIIGILGMLMVFAIYPIFKWLAKRDHIMTITWVYVFTLIIVLTFAIEIGQKVSGTGAMEFADIVFGVVGFLLMYFVFAMFRLIYHGILELIERRRNRY